MDNTQTQTMTIPTYNGYKNYETWNVSLWIQNDFGLYNIAKDCQQSECMWDAFQETMIDCQGITMTPDGVMYNDPEIDGLKIAEVIAGL